ncbi:DEAD/DEAH box helicase [Periweissella fabaria]|uniref:UvrABC system protein B n=1 Tax=Periweissella fabaria TaxID=546157 RepID=A0ABM8Z735_9LACO|nr:DEAD/DEAH box helicase [Periweissella fabaria]MCM0597744.1 DEAD/DEAH box helicase [Periweissella fabaria]CAH0417193.1 UvrABC system protein B [Periweissella fabaria]
MQEDLTASLAHGMVRAQANYQSPLTPTLITNTDLNLGDCLNNELATAKTFIFAVAFITEGGLLMLKTKLADLALQGIKGKIITSTYLGFNQPKMFAELLKLTNVDVEIVTEGAFHTKAYYIEHADYHTIFVGSGNLTATALKTNLEWTVKLNSLTDGAFTHQFQEALAQLSVQAIPLTPAWLASYEAQYQAPTQAITTVSPSSVIMPNQMQVAALKALQAHREAGAKRSLVVSATGTGKTYLAAFDIQQVQPKRVLFIAHREQLLKQAKATFQKIFTAKQDTFGIYSGSQHNGTTRFVFASIQTLTKHYTEFDPTAFDYIVIDETHRAKAPSYQLLFAYFKSAFMLGITATPERTDGFNVYELFDYNLAYEISLADALAADMLVPFNYIGVADYQVDDEVITDVTALKYLIADERVEHLIAKTNYYGYAGQQLHGLIFVSRIEEGEILAEKLTARGLPSQFLSAQSSSVVREKAVTALEQGTLKYLIAVDIFNEGIDIPAVNQIVMMRSTQSKIIFLQQLGRGLRKFANKEYLTVIDFIGNYQNNYLIPQAFGNGTVTDKDRLRMQVMQPQISGLSTINFEAIAAQQILQAVTAVKFDRIAELKQQFQMLCNRFGRVPTLVEVYQSQQMDVRLILNKFKIYPAFVSKMTGEIGPTLAADFTAWLQFVSQELAFGQRRHELLILEALLKQGSLTTMEVLTVLDNEYHDQATLASMLKVLGIKDYFTAIDRRKYGNIGLVNLVGDTWELARKFDDLEQKMLLDVIEAGLLIISASNDGQNQFTLYQKYRRKDVVRLLNWASDLPSIDIGGYKYDVATQTLPIFITLEKNGQAATAMTYDNSFRSPNRIPFYSKANRTLNSPIEAALFDADKRDIFVPLFVKKSDDEGAAFYYLGPVTVDQVATQTTELLNQRTQKMQPVVRFELVLNTDVPIHLWEYLVQ